jgi:hypothetical protein
VLALALLGVEGIDELRARDELHRLAGTGYPCSPLRVAVALLMGRAEVAFAKERGDWRECENVRAHFRHLVAHGYQVGAGEVGQLASLFSIDSLDAPGLRAGWRSFSADAASDVDGDAVEGDPEAQADRTRVRSRASLRVVVNDREEPDFLISQNQHGRAHDRGPRTRVNPEPRRQCPGTRCPRTDTVFSGPPENHRVTRRVPR